MRLVPRRAPIPSPWGVVAWRSPARWLGPLVLGSLVLGVAVPSASAGAKKDRRLARQGFGNAVFPTDPDLRVGSEDCEAGAGSPALTSSSQRCQVVSSVR